MDNKLLFIASNLLWLAAIVYFQYVKKSVGQTVKSFNDYFALTALNCYYPDSIVSQGHEKMSLSDLENYDLYAFQRASEPLALLGNTFSECEQTPMDLDIKNTAIAFRLDQEDRLLGISFSPRMHSLVNKYALFESNTIKCTALFNSNGSLFIGSVFQSQKSEKSNNDIIDFYSELKKSYKKIILLGHLLDGHKFIKQKAANISVNMIPNIESEYTEIRKNKCSDYILTNEVIMKYHMNAIRDNLDIGTLGAPLSPINTQMYIQADIYLSL